LWCLNSDPYSGMCGPAEAVGTRDKYTDLTSQFRNEVNPVVGPSGRQDKEMANAHGWFLSDCPGWWGKGQTWQSRWLGDLRGLLRVAQGQRAGVRVKQGAAPRTPARIEGFA